jgi:hypothetical protein
MPDRPYGGAAGRLHAAILAAIHAYSGAPEGTLRLVKLAPLANRNPWRSAGRRELMDARGRDDGGRAV